MSYIRCLSNPEGLYIWGDCEGDANICWTISPPLSSKKAMIIVPIQVFEEAAKEWANCGNDKVSIDGFEVEEKHVYMSSGKEVINKKPFSRRPTNFLIKLSYKGRFVFLWRVTWQYVVNSVLATAKRRE